MSVHFLDEIGVGSAHAGLPYPPGNGIEGVPGNTRFSRLPVEKKIDEEIASLGGNQVARIKGRNEPKAELDILRKSVPLWAIAAEIVGPVMPYPLGSWCVCPFHEEPYRAKPSPSMRIDQGSDGAWRYRCLSCNASGDIFQFIAKTKGISLRTAIRRVKTLAANDEWMKSWQDHEKAFHKRLKRQERHHRYNISYKGRSRHCRYRQSENGRAKRREQARRLRSRRLYERDPRTWIYRHWGL